MRVQSSSYGAAYMMETVSEECDMDSSKEPEDGMNCGGRNGERKSNKPIMEKRRRARINNCLSELKEILLEAMRKDPARHSKLEKADILELTVRHLQNIQRNQLAIAMATDPTVLQRFKNGFSECATEVGRYMTRLEGTDSGAKQRITEHLANCINGLQQVGPSGGSNYTSPAFARLGATLPSMQHSILIPTPQLGTPSSSIISPTNYLPTAGDFNNNSRYGTQPNPSAPSTVTSTQIRQNSCSHDENNCVLESPSPTSGLDSSFKNTSTSSSSSSGNQSMWSMESDEKSNENLNVTNPSNPIDFSVSRPEVNDCSSKQSEYANSGRIDVERKPVDLPQKGCGKDNMWRPW